MKNAAGGMAPTAADEPRRSLPIVAVMTSIIVPVPPVAVMMTATRLLAHPAATLFPTPASEVIAAVVAVTAIIGIVATPRLDDHGLDALRYVMTERHWQPMFRIAAYRYGTASHQGK